MKNRNYIILGNLFAILIGIIYVMLTNEFNHAPIWIYWDFISWLIIAIPLIALYITAYPDINQVSSFIFTQYKLRWLQNMSIYLGLFGTFLGFTFMWFGTFTPVLSADIIEENILVNIIHTIGEWLQIDEIGKALGAPSEQEGFWGNHSPAAHITFSLAIAAITCVYAILFSFTLLLLNIHSDIFFYRLLLCFNLCQLLLLTAIRIRSLR